MTSPLQTRLPRRHFVGLVAALGATKAFAGPEPAVSIQVWKDPNCGGCKDWIAHLEHNGFTISVLDHGNGAARARLGMPHKLGSWHTALVQGYVVEGHVPVFDIRRLLNERPTALGLAVPGLPIGSPGMDGPAYGSRRDPYQVLLVRKDGSTTEFSNHS